MLLLCEDCPRLRPEDYFHVNGPEQFNLLRNNVTSFMPTNLTEQEFSRHLNSMFQVRLEDHVLELKLVEVNAYLPGKNEQAGMERFSIYFDGPQDLCLPQNVYHLEHPAMGELDLFLVPVAASEKGFRYEAVFNYFKAENES